MTRRAALAVLLVVVFAGCASTAPPRSTLPPVVTGTIAVSDPPTTDEPNPSSLTGPATTVASSTPAETRTITAGTVATEPDMSVCGSWWPGAPVVTTPCTYRDGSVYVPRVIACVDGRMLVIGNPNGAAPMGGTVGSTFTPLPDVDTVINDCVPGGATEQ